MIADDVLGLEEIYIKNKKKISYKSHFNSFEKISFEKFMEEAKLITYNYFNRDSIKYLFYISKSDLQG